MTKLDLSWPVHKPYDCGSWFLHILIPTCFFFFFFSHNLVPKTSTMSLAPTYFVVKMFMYTQNGLSHFLTVHTEVLSHWTIFTLRWLHTENSSNWGHVLFFYRNGGKYCLACAMICSLIFLSSLLNSWFWSNGSFWRMVFHALLIVFKIQFALGLPTLRFELSLGNADWVANVTWCWGCCLFRLRTCPNSFNFLSSNISVRGLILLSGPSVGAFSSSLALLYT